MTAHALLSPSAAHRWARCPASAGESLGVPRSSSVFADEGTAAHTVAARALDYGKPAAFFLGERIYVTEASKFEVDEDMAEAVQVYLDYLDRNTAPWDTRLHEQRISYSETLGIDDQFGTSDCFILSADGSLLTVVDYKHGKGETVDAKDNYQLLSYALGVLETFAPLMDAVKHVRLAIVQPRCDNISEAEYTRQEVTAFADTLRSAALDAKRCVQYAERGEPIPKWLYVPSEKACRWCPVKATCEARRESLAAEIYGDFEALTDENKLVLGPPPPAPPVDRLGLVYGRLDEIGDFCRAVRAEVERMVFAGMTVTGPDGQPMKIIEGRRGARQWINDEAAEGALLGVLPPDKAYEPRKLVSPAKAEKAIGKKSAHWTALQSLIRQPPGKPKVTLGSAEGTPYSGEAKAEEFTNLTNEE